MNIRPGARMAAVILAVLPVLSASAASGREVSGKREFSGEVIVPKGETWRVLPGAEVRFRGGMWVIRGKLSVEGTRERPVRIVGDDAFEGIDIRGQDGTKMTNAVLSGGRRGARVTNAVAVFREVRFERNGIGLEAGQYARVRVEGCDFEGNSRVGILVKRGGAVEVSGSRFSGALKAGVYVYGADNVLLRECRFERNAVGVQGTMAGARFRVTKSVFRGNGVGILAGKTAAPEVTDCEVARNDTGFRFARRAEGNVTGCRIEENGTGALVEYSSYPVFRGNEFRRNREMAVRLRHQSSQWEGEATEGDREGIGAPGVPFGGGDEARGDFRPRGGTGSGAYPAGPPGRKAGLNGTVDFRGNRWGDLQPQVDEGGNVSGIHDGYDEPSFEYKGKRYRMDTVLLK